MVSGGILSPGFLDILLIYPWAKSLLSKCDSNVVMIVYNYKHSCETVLL